MDILTDVVWRFKRAVPVTIEEFGKAFARYQIDILKDKANWRPEEILINSSTIGVVYRAWLTGSCELFDNEIILEKGDFFDDLRNRDGRGLYQADILAEIISDNERGFSGVELMYKISHQISSRDLGQQVYFEGLQEYEIGGEFPCFRLNCGS